MIQRFVIKKLTPANVPLQENQVCRQRAEHYHFSVHFAIHYQWGKVLHLWESSLLQHMAQEEKSPVISGYMNRHISDNQPTTIGLCSQFHTSFRGKEFF